MLKYKNDQRIVLILDAGGTHFVFSAIRENHEIITPVVQSAPLESLDQCIHGIVQGFKKMIENMSERPEAISIAFPGPADYFQGIIGDLPNLSCFRGGIPLGPILQKELQLPVFINNDGDLFAYGEALCGLLPYVNRMIEKTGNARVYRNLFGITLGTGFGAGLVVDNKMHRGDNSAAAEVWAIRHPMHSASFMEEGVSIRALRRNYAEFTGVPSEETPLPEDIFKIAKGMMEGNQEAAIKTFHIFGKVLGSALATIVSVVDGLVVIGGGLSGAYEFFISSLIKEMNRPLYTLDGSREIDPVLHAFNLNDPDQLNNFIRGKVSKINIPGTEKNLVYDPYKRTGVGISSLGTSRAIGIGSYAFALDCLDHMH